MTRLLVRLVPCVSALLWMAAVTGEYADLSWDASVTTTTTTSTMDLHRQQLATVLQMEDWIQNANNIHRMALLRNNGEPLRGLQYQSADYVCEQYVKSGNGEFNCTCEDLGKLNVAVHCRFAQVFCNADNSTCFNRDFSVAIDPNSQSRRTTTCVSFVVSKDNQPKPTCVEIVPAVPSLYNETITCSVTLNNQTCNYCVPCSNGKNGRNVTISFDCCNVEQDKQAKCSYVSTSGATLALFDDVAQADVGKCTGVRSAPSAAATPLSSWFSWFLSTMTAATLVLVVTLE